MNNREVLRKIGTKRRFVLRIIKIFEISVIYNKERRHGKFDTHKPSGSEGISE